MIYLRSKNVFIVLTPFQKREMEKIYPEVIKSNTTLIIQSKILSNFKFLVGSKVARIPSSIASSGPLVLDNTELNNSKEFGPIHEKKKLLGLFLFLISK